MIIGAIIDNLISIKDHYKKDLHEYHINAINNACNILYHNFNNFTEHQDAIAGDVKVKEYTSFEMNYLEDCKNDKEDNSIAKYYIDGYAEDTDVGTVIATVSLTEHHDIVIDWHYNGYRSNSNVLELIEEAKRELKRR